ncbi:hypothetical protein [Salinibacterium sp.]|uniref:hypothetical protein n=1 Tax=Salinibacterium sp. TaxID=1915057 RepID=UPI00286D635F|nr:hypothetical protein [Salinibacterium sp.]
MVTVRATRQVRITLPNEMADALRQRVSSGAYASGSKVVSAYDALAADPSAVVSVDVVRARLSAKHA